MKTKENLKQNNAITLIILILTILILLILITISIIIFNKTQIIEQTGTTKLEVIKGEVKEQIHLDIYDIQTDDKEDLYKPSLQTLHDKLPTEDKRITMDEYNKDEDKNISGSYYYDENHEYIFEIDGDQNITGKLIQTNFFDMTISDITTNSFKITGNVSKIRDIKDFTYVVEKSNVDKIEKNNIKENSITISGLKDNTQYKVYMVVSDTKGKYFKSEIKTVTTKAMPTDAEIKSGAIAFGSVTWSNGKASVGISTNTSYTIQYQVNSITGTWTTGTNVTGIANGSTVYARLTDGVNATGYASVVIADKTAPTVTLTQGTITVNSIAVMAKATDGQSGVKSYAFFVNNEQKQTGSSGTYNATNLNPGANYTIKVVVKDNAGNSTEKSVTATTIDHLGELKTVNGKTVATQKGGLYNTPYYYYSVVESVPSSYNYSCNCTTSSYKCNCTTSDYDCNCRTYSYADSNNCLQSHQEPRCTYEYNCAGSGKENDKGMCCGQATYITICDRYGTYSQTYCDTCSKETCETCSSTSCSTCTGTTYNNVTNYYYGTSYSGTLISTYYIK